MTRIYLKRQPIIALSYYDEAGEYKAYEFDSANAAMEFLKKHYSESTIKAYYFIA